jgi:hypothetical protein
MLFLQDFRRPSQRYKNPLMAVVEIESAHSKEIDARTKHLLIIMFLE